MTVYTEVRLICDGAPGDGLGTCGYSVPITGASVNDCRATAHRQGWQRTTRGRVYVDLCVFHKTRR